MDELADFGAVVLVVAGGVLLALVASKLSDRFPIPAPALFLLAAAAIPVVIPEVRTVSESVSLR